MSSEANNWMDLWSYESFDESANSQLGNNSLMGNSQVSEGSKALSNGQKIILRLRYRDIILHYSFKMKVNIADIGIFPDHL